MTLTATTRWMLGALLALGLVTTGCGGGGATTSSTGDTRVPTTFDFGGNDRLKVTAFGDSITLGELGERSLLRRGSPRRVTSANYPNQLQAMLRGLDPGWRVVNRGVGGETSDAGRQRLSGALGSDHSGFVLLMEGTNDSERGVSPDTIAANLDSMIGIAEGSHAVAIIGTIAPNFRNDPGSRAVIDEANRKIRDLAQRRRVTLAEIFNGMNDRTLFGTPEEGINDPLHPNERGYAVMAGIWFDAMQKTIPRGPTSAPPVVSPPLKKR
jgi:lysophospholipase L1-like esterase